MATVAVPSRPMIAASWRRSAEAGLTVADGHARYCPDLEVEGRFLKAARIPLRRLAERFDTVSAVLSDARSRVLARIDTDTRLGRMLDGVELAPGFDYGEASVGTNAMGTAVEAHCVVDIRGPEHFSERLRPFSCLGAPVRDPLTGRVEGILDLTSRAEDFSAQWHAPLRVAVAEIEHELLIDRDAQHELFDEYARLALRSRDAVGAVGAVTLLVNRIMHENFDAGDQEALRAHAALITENREHAEDVIDLPSGRRVRIRARVAGLTRASGILFDVREVLAEDQRLVAPRKAAVHTPALLRARQEIATALRQDHPLVLTGEMGVGKAHLARALYREAVPTGRIFSIECATADAHEQIDAALSAAGPRLILLRHTAAVAGGFDGRAVLQAEQGDSELRVLATFTAQESDPSAVRGFSHAVIVPALRRRVAEIPALADELLNIIAPGRWLAPAAQRLLMRYDWPGNIPQLEEALARAVQKRPVGSILGDDLPHFVLEAGGLPTGSLEQAERSAIIDALRDTGGNRVHAARLLGIGRATLYRKLHRYGIEAAAG